MDILRKIFGLQSAPSSSEDRAEKVETESSAKKDASEPKTSPPESDSAKAPVAETEAVSTTQEPPGEVMADTDMEASDEGMAEAVDAFEDEGHTKRLPDINMALQSIKSGRQSVYGQKTDVGQVRNNNQDAILSLVYSFTGADEQPDLGMFIVADGMGGHHDGEKASSLTARVVAHYTYHQIFVPLVQNEGADEERPTVSEVLREAIQKANRDVATHVPEGGTTCTAAAIIGDLAYIAHVGDSRAYVINSDGMEQLTRDHSLVQRLIELDQLTPEEAADHPQKNVLYRAIGQNENVDVDAITRRLTAGSRLLICSDGLWNMVPDDEIRNTVLSSPDTQSACETLVKLANSRGGLDNISVIIVYVPD